jgi:hypothetical protein
VATQLHIDQGVGYKWFRHFKEGQLVIGKRFTEEEEIK